MDTRYISMEIDTSKPNAGRIYDYFLGGSHNFDADRAAAEQLLTLIPSARGGARLNRWFMYDAVERLAQAGFDCFLDLASGLPTEGYIHELVPTARVLYNDIDPVTVAYGRDIVGTNPNVRYIQANIADMDTVLSAAASHFGPQRRIAVCFIGVTYFLEDAPLQAIFERLYDWCAPGSQIAMSWLAGEPGDVASFKSSQFAAMYKRLNSPVFARELSSVHAMLSKWRISEPGLLPLGEWNGVDRWRVEAEGIEEAPLDIYGVLVTKE